MASELKQPEDNCPICGSPSIKPCALNCQENLRITGRNYGYGQCLDCKVISQMPVPNGEALSSYYQQIDEHQKSQWNTPQGQALLTKMQRRQSIAPSWFRGTIRELASAGEQLYPYWHLLNKGSIVDLGAGSGGFCLEARKRGWDVQGLEQSHRSVELAHQLGFDLIEADLASDQAKQLIANADNVVLNHVFEHVVDPRNFLQLLRSMMKPGARLVLLLPNPDSLWRYVFGSRWYGWDPPVHVHHYSAAALRSIIQRERFRVIKICSIRRHDSLATGLSTVGVSVGRLRLLLRVLMVPVMPFLALAGAGPELLCVAEVPPKGQ